VGIGSDFDGIDKVPKGLEDVSKYPHLIAELIRRGWTRYQVAQLAGGNILRVLEGAEGVAARLQRVHGPSMAKYDKRHDLDGGWGGFEL
jgi:membrane dipeptidase